MILLGYLHIPLLMGGCQTAAFLLHSDTARVFLLQQYRKLCIVLSILTAKILERVFLLREPHVGLKKKRMATQVKKLPCESWSSESCDMAESGRVFRGAGAQDETSALLGGQLLLKFMKI